MWQMGNPKRAAYVSGYEAAWWKVKVFIGNEEKVGLWEKWSRFGSSINIFLQDIYPLQITVVNIPRLEGNREFLHPSRSMVLTMLLDYNCDCKTVIKMVKTRAGAGSRTLIGMTALMLCKCSKLAVIH